MEGKTLYIFDMDDTLLKTPKLFDFVNVNNGDIVTDDTNVQDAVKKLKSFFWSIFFKNICFEKKDEEIFVVDCESKRKLGSEYIGFIEDLSQENVMNSGEKSSSKKNTLRIVGEKDGNLIVRQIPGFYNKKETLGNIINPDVFKIYKSAKNKMIITGRNEELREDIIQNFLDNGIDLPNFGLYLFKGGRKGISDFKVETIINTIKENNWEEIHFFEDRQDWLNKAEQEVVNFFPKIKFHKHLVVSDK
ncbi:MAG: hypothetical protein WC466_08015 [Candidatus Izemoplasmatales bacterium]